MKQINLPSKYLDENVRSRLLELLKSDEGTCSKTRGVITEIVSLNAVLDNDICPADGSNRFTVDYTFRCVLPAKGDRTRGRVITAFEEGAFVQCDGYQTLAIGGKYVKNAYEYECCSVRPNDEVQLVITDVDFKDGKFYCVGEHRCFPSV